VPPAEIVTGQYHNRRFASVVPRAVFVGGKPVADAVITLPVRRLEHAPLLAGSPGIEPQAASTPARIVAESAGRGVAAKLAKARDTLTRIIIGRGQKKHSVEIAIARTPVRSALAAEKHDPRLRAVADKKKHEAARTHPAATRSLAPSKIRLRKVEGSGKSIKSRAAALQADASGG
jgi:hypothetical protein